MQIDFFFYSIIKHLLYKLFQTDYYKRKKVKKKNTKLISRSPLEIKRDLIVFKTTTTYIDDRVFDFIQTYKAFCTALVKHPTEQNCKIGRERIQVCFTFIPSYHLIHSFLIDFYTSFFIHFFIYHHPILSQQKRTTSLFTSVFLTN